ncbi:substrate-binding domain-containing protein [Catenulispora sp. NF23]|uniref:Substrate-binding domain-containing protein n=1 Tax=Catenulispora pinistramenti TaxID=2705254 RepID=A0ABS5KLC5_9ACTN|nr:substrate-binding domain-containing protein [Catenulispora pinistramenti]MBS2532063.1 substrate-binding domain-containing protein [Catenulispora pinistramenti]MBS2546836.1 substrate-binding domain-containing protein [Catenulispora pinistramenti]
MRSVTRKLAITSAVAAAVLGATVASNGAALADPPAGTTPAATDIVAAGSDTIQAFDNGLSTQYNATSPASKFYTWDATGTSPITPKTGATSIPRPNGSGQGITALNNNTNATLDIARSSRGPNTGTADWFIPFAQDAVGWAGFTGGNAPTDLTSADLQGIYTCSITNWNQITDEPGYTGPNATIDPIVPQSGSGTRSFFLSALNITAASEPCWNATTPEENEGTASVFAGDVNAVFPYSLSHAVGQLYDGKGSGTDNIGVLDVFRSIDGNTQIDQTNKVWNANFPLTYTREVYHVVRQSDWADATEGPRLKALLDRSTNGGYLCGTAASSLITSYGFQTLGNACGTLTAGQ